MSALPTAAPNRRHRRHALHPRTGRGAFRERRNPRLFRTTFPLANRAVTTRRFRPARKPSSAPSTTRETSEGRPPNRSEIRVWFSFTCSRVGFVWGRTETAVCAPLCTSNCSPSPCPAARPAGARPAMTRRPTLPPHKAGRKGVTSARSAADQRRLQFTGRALSALQNGTSAESSITVRVARSPLPRLPSARLMTASTCAEPPLTPADGSPG